MAIAFLPILIGLLLGTPLIASEIEAKTNRLAWSQGVTRTRWLLSTWLVLVIPTLIVMSLLALVVQWWTTHVVASVFSGGGLIQPFLFHISGVAPIATAVFALSFCMCVAVFFRWFTSIYVGAVLGLLAFLSYVSVVVVPALAAKTVIVTSSYGVTKLPLSLGTRPWLTASGYRREPGFHVGPHASSVGQIVQHCSNVVGSGRIINGGKGIWGCLRRYGVQAISVYQPQRHYWTRQWREAGLYVVLAGIFLGMSVWAARWWRA